MPLVCRLILTGTESYCSGGGDRTQETASHRSPSGGIAASGEGGGAIYLWHADKGEWALQTDSYYGSTEAPELQAHNIISVTDAQRLVDAQRRIRVLVSEAERFAFMGIVPTVVAAGLEIAVRYEHQE
ncbi:MAG: hypothetical protein H6729_03235 [Deltaproteobacteria bacterium]|nr:hypothetical protein [Deltaproteobacteria bacterium]